MTAGPMWPDYVRFHALAVRTGDVDPVYPVLRALAPSYGPAGTAWLSFLHVAYYDLGSAVRAYEILGGSHPSRARLDEVLRLPTGTERRAHRSPAQLLKHLNALVDLGEHFGDHYRAVTAFARQNGWPLAYESLSSSLFGIYGNGRWAAYKTCELLSHSLEPFMGRNASRLEPVDMGMRYSSGPRQGLALLDPSLPYGESAPAIARLDAAAEELVAALRRHDLDVPIPATMATAETTLCDYHSMVVGRYYVGHDIDQMRWQLIRAMAQTNDPDEGTALLKVSDAARPCFPWEYWGHLPDVKRRQHYKTTGEILTR